MTACHSALCACTAYIRGVRALYTAKVASTVCESLMGAILFAGYALAVLVIRMLTFVRALCTYRICPCVLAVIAAYSAYSCELAMAALASALSAYSLLKVVLGTFKTAYLADAVLVFMYALSAAGCTLTVNKVMLYACIAAHCTYFIYKIVVALLTAYCAKSVLSVAMYTALFTYSAFSVRAVCVSYCFATRCAIAILCVCCMGTYYSARFARAVSAVFLVFTLSAAAVTDTCRVLFMLALSAGGQCAYCHTENKQNCENFFLHNSLLSFFAMILPYLMAVGYGKIQQDVTVALRRSFTASSQTR